MRSNSSSNSYAIKKKDELERTPAALMSSPNASPTSSSMLPRAPPTATLSRRRMNWSALPSPTDKHGSFGSDGGFRDAFNPEPSLKKRNYLLVHAKLPTLGKRFSLAEK